MSVHSVVTATQNTQDSLFSINKSNLVLKQISQNAAIHTMEDRNGNINSAAHYSGQNVEVKKILTWDKNLPSQVVASKVHFMHAVDFIPMVFNGSKLQVQLIHRADDGNVAGGWATIGGMVDPRSRNSKSVLDVIKQAFTKQGRIGDYNKFIELVKGSGFDPRSDASETVESNIEAAIREASEEVFGKSADGSGILDNPEDIVDFISTIESVKCPFKRSYQRDDFRLISGSFFEDRGVYDGDVAIITTAPVSVRYSDKATIDRLSDKYCNLDKNEIKNREWVNVSDFLNNEIDTRSSGSSSSLGIDGHFEMVIASTIRYLQSVQDESTVEKITSEQMQDIEEIYQCIKKLYKDISPSLGSNLDLSNLQRG